MREANARLKIVLNSASKPPIPIFSNLKFGWMIELAAGRRFDGFMLIPVLASLKKFIGVCLVSIPLDLGSESVGADESPGFSEVRSIN